MSVNCSVQHPLWMRSSRVVRSSDSQCRSRNCPGFDPSIIPDKVESEGRQMKLLKQPVLRIRNRIRKDPKLLAGSGSDPEQK